MSQDTEYPLPTPEVIDSTVEPVASTPKKEPRKTRRGGVTKSPLTTITIDDTGVCINSQSVREQSFNLWLDGKKSERKSNELVSSISTQPGDVIINANTVREVVFQNWLAEKEEKLVRRERMKRFELSERQKLVEAELSLRKDKSTSSFDNWCKKKDTKITLSKKQIANESQEREAEQALKAENQKEEASLMYHAWAEQSDKRRTSVVRKKRQKILEKERVKLEEEETKKIEAVKMYDAWRIQKDALLRESVREKRDSEIKKQEIIAEKRRQKAENAVLAYDAWLQCKEEEKSELDGLTRILTPSLDGKWRPPGPSLPDYPRSSETRKMDGVMDGRRGQLRVTTAKHSATAAQPDH